jgi:hypothetical protein
MWFAVAYLAAVVLLTWLGAQFPSHLSPDLGWSD